MDIRALTIFKTVADEGGVSRAAQRLNCVQSNVTARLKQLEDELGVELFYRKSRGMALTPHGEALVPYASEAIRLLGDAARAVREESGMAGSLALGTMESTAAVRLPGLLSAYHRRFPQVELRVTTGTTQELAQQVLDYSLEGAFVAGPLEHADLEPHPAFDERLAIITEPGAASPAKLERPTFLVFRKGCSYRAALEAWARENGLIPGAIMELGTLEGMLGFVAAGLGLSLLPVSVVENLGRADSVRVHPIPGKLGRNQTLFIRRKNGLLTQALRSLLDLLPA